MQDNHSFNLRRDDSSTKNVRILDKDNIHNNSVQVINQYEAEGMHKNRYDVTILIKETEKFMTDAFRDGELKFTGTEFANILPPVSMFDKDNTRMKKKATVSEKLEALLEKYLEV